jgi:hypothetical protein
MADFRQWALEFVLADDEGRQTAIAQKAANGTYSPNMFIASPRDLL